jgi:hypothetical protein
MMTDHDFKRIVHEAFWPFLKNLGFSVDDELLSGRVCRASFISPTHAVAVSYEPGDEAIFVFIYSVDRGQLSDVDDESKTLQLPDLSAHYMKSVTSEERTANEALFKNVEAHDDAARNLLKAAKELRLVLPKYLTDRER